MSLTKILGDLPHCILFFNSFRRGLVYKSLQKEFWLPLLIFTCTPVIKRLCGRRHYQRLIYVVHWNRRAERYGSLNTLRGKWRLKLTKERSLLTVYSSHHINISKSTNSYENVMTNFVTVNKGSWFLQVHFSA